MCANVGVSGCRWWHRAYARVYIQSCGRGVASPIRVAVTWPRVAACGRVVWPSRGHAVSLGRGA